ncbi:MAG: hemolysin family protein [Brachybacterium sp.]|nr:hemolysin family protein [Brachybacterium sp.]
MGTTVLLILLGIAIILALIAANGLFVAQEFAYMSVDRSRLRARAAEGDQGAARALEVTGRTSFMLSGAQLGITVTGLLVGYVAEPLVGESLGRLLGTAGVPAALSISLGTAGVLVIATIVQMIFGELYPKNLSIAAPEPIAKALSRSTLIYLKAFGWLITVFDKAADALLRAVRMEPVHDVDSTATAEDLGRIVADSLRSGDMPEELGVLIDRVLDFPEQDAEHAMIPRSQVDTVEEDTTIGELREMMARAHTRYPVLDDDGDPVGLVQLTDLLRSDHPDDAPVTAIMQESLVVPERMPLPDALAKMAAARQELVCVIDEFGTFAGILTVEDLAEELVGELHDEHDEDLEDVTEDGEDSWEMDGDIHVDELERLIGHPMPEGEYETLAGLLISELGELPAEGQTMRISLPEVPSDYVSDEMVERSLEVEVLEIDKHVPSRVHVELDVTPVDEDAAAAQAAAEAEAASGADAEDGEGR